MLESKRRRAAKGDLPQPPKTDVYGIGQQHPLQSSDKDTAVRLRGPRKTDTTALTDVLASPGVLAGYSVLPYVSEYQIEQKLQHDDSRHWIIATVKDMPVGFVVLEWGVGRWRNIATLGMAVADQYGGQGIGRRLIEAALEVGFRYLNLNKIELVVYVDNSSAVHLYKSCHFVLEGTKRENAMRDGIHVDAQVMSILRADFENAKAQNWSPIRHSR